MSYPHGRGHSGHHDGRPRLARHPNWGHPDHDACGTGFMARLGGAPSYDIVQHALTALERLTHRGGVHADGASGDRAGLLTSLPQAFFRARSQEQGTDLPELFAVGFAFLPSSEVDEARAPIYPPPATKPPPPLPGAPVPPNPNSLAPRPAGPSP